jgi:hypothetical protein
VGFLDTAEIFGFYENWGISWPVERLSLSQEKLCSMELKYFLKISSHQTLKSIGTDSTPIFRAAAILVSLEKMC